MFKKINEKALDMFSSADLQNRANILNMLDQHKSSRLLDLGCDDGVFTAQCRIAASADYVAGVEVVSESASKAIAHGIDVSISDLSERLPFGDDTFDLVTANQVIEHVPSVDQFMSEVCRVLSPGGKAIISTENGSSWINIGASILGWQQFSLTNVSSKGAGIGNPVALHRGQQSVESTWTHKTIFNYLGLVEFVELYGLQVIDVKGAGYFPLPTWVSKFDTRHSHFLTILCSK